MEGICCHDARRVQLHSAYVARLVRRITTVHKARMRWKTSPILTVRVQRREHERKVVGDHALSPICRNDTRDPRSEGCFVLTRPTEDDHFALLDRRERSEDARSI